MIKMSELNLNFTFLLKGSAVCFLVLQNAGH